MSDFKVSVRNGAFQVVTEDEVPETDIIDLLEFDENQIEDLYKTHAAIQARWEQVAINYRNRLELFRDDFEKKWWAHNKKFAKLLALSYGEKTPTIESIKDNVVLIYSEETSEFLRSKYANLCYETYISRAGVHHDSQEDFTKDMFKYVTTNPAWSFESIVRTSAELKKQVETLQNIAKRLEARSFHMKDLKDLVMAKQSNMGPMYDSEKPVKNYQGLKPR